MREEVVYLQSDVTEDREERHVPTVTNRKVFVLGCRLIYVIPPLRDDWSERRVFTSDDRFNSDSFK